MDRLAPLYGLSETGGFRIIEATQSSPLSTPPTLTPGNTGLVGTASDYMRFAQTLLNGGELDGVRLLGAKTVRWMTQNHLPKSLQPIEIGPDFRHPGYGFGLGFRVRTSAVGADTIGSEGDYGWGGSAGTRFWVDPEEALVGLIMLQLSWPWLRIQDTFRALTYQATDDLAET